jgi:cytochrome b561
LELPTVTDDDDGLPHASRGRPRLAGAAAMYRPTFALLILVVGQLGLIQDSLPKPAPGSWMNLHAVFAALLWICIVARFYRRMRRTPAMLPAEVHALARELSRQVYLLLYVLMFTSLLIGLVHAVPEGARSGRAENFQSYLAGGIAALITIRALAALCHRFVMQGHRFVIPGHRFVVQDRRLAQGPRFLPQDGSRAPAARFSETGG